jgi:hypothetical protein
MDRPLRLLIVFAGTLVVAATGCRVHDDAGRYMLYGELRTLEDANYTLRDRVALLQSQLDSCRRAGAASRGAESVEPSGVAPPATDVLPPLGVPPLDVPPGEFTPPKVDLGPETPPPAGSKPDGPSSPEGTSSPKGQTPQQRKKPAASGDSEPDTVPPDAPPKETPKETPKGRAESLLIHPLLSGGYNTDGTPGDEGVLVVVVPQDADAAPVEAFGEVEVRLAGTSPSRSGLLAVWRFDADEIAQRYRRTIVGRAIQLDLPWPGDPPADSDLRLGVTLKTADGRTLRAAHDIHVQLAGGTSRGWARSRSKPNETSHDESTGAGEVHPARRSSVSAPSSASAARAPAAQPPPPQTRPAWSPHRQP